MAKVRGFTAEFGNWHLSIFHRRSVLEGYLLTVSSKDYKKAAGKKRQERSK